MIPSVKTLKQITSYPCELRKLLECKSAEQLIKWIDSESKPFGKRSKFPRFSRSHHGYMFVSGPRFHSLKLNMADELCETCGVEYTAKGHNSKSPAFEYLNAGDTYAVTLLYVNGRYRVGCWGDIVERGHYD